TSAESNLADARSTVTSLLRQHAEYAAERRRVQVDLDRLHRMRDAGERLANIEFVVCPRCLQSLTQRSTPDGTCRVCLQPDPVDGGKGDTDQYEAQQLTDQLAEMDDQLQVIAEQISATTNAVADREQLVDSLTAKIDARTSERITPRL